MLASAVHAAHPLITDDTGTQGKGKFEFELNGEYGSDRETSRTAESRERVLQGASALAYGATDKVDVIVGIPYLRAESRESDSAVPLYAETREKGFSDLLFEVKWQFFEHEGASLAIKPGLSVPTGNERKGLGAGKYGYSVFLIATEELKPLTFHMNIGYLRNNNRADQREDLYHLSVACEYEMAERLRLVTNIGQERNPDRTVNRDPAFGILGVIYGVTENFDLDAGVKLGLNDPETDIATMAGITIRF